ncbi:MAG: nucleoside-diphosphate kinase [Flavobacteriales bacterium]
MQGTRTFTIIKPDAVEAGYAGKILDHVIANGFRILAFKFTCLSKTEAEAFYAVHKDRPFFEDLTSFMSSGPIYAGVLEKANAVEAYRDLIGATDPAEAEAGTVRALWATDKGKNAVHGADSDETAKEEAAFFFSQRELYR